MALASLNGIAFRINPSSIDWGYSIDTNVENTIGGRVVQVIGATLTDITLSGYYGERKGYRYADKRRDRALTPGRSGPMLSWELAEAFLERVRKMMDEQSEDSREQGKMQRPLDFKFPEYGWHFGVYVKGIDDGKSNAGVTHTAGSFSYQWRLSLFIVEERSGALVLPGKSSSIADQKKAQAINGYISRISSGVGWRKTKFNQPAIEERTTGSSSAGGAAPATPPTPPAHANPDARNLP